MCGQEGGEGNAVEGMSNARNAYGQSALHIAAAAAFVDGIKILVRHTPWAQSAASHTATRALIVNSL
jgi:ankyrin repeat protein